MPTSLRRLTLLALFPIVGGCSSRSLDPPLAGDRGIAFHVTGYRPLGPGLWGADTLSFEVRANGVQVLDTTFVFEPNLEGHVMTRILRLSPGPQRLEVLDRRVPGPYEVAFVAVPGSTYVRFHVLPGGGTLSFGEGMLVFH